VRYGEGCLRAPLCGRRGAPADDMFCRMARQACAATRSRCATKRGYLLRVMRKREGYGSGAAGPSPLIRLAPSPYENGARHACTLRAFALPRIRVHAVASVTAASLLTFKSIMSGVTVKAVCCSPRWRAAEFDVDLFVHDFSHTPPPLPWSSSGHHVAACSLLASPATPRPAGRSGRPLLPTP